MRKFLVIVSIAGIGLIYYSGAFKNKDIGNPDNKEFNFNFNLKDLENKSFSFKKYKGKVVFINLWATWCGPCRYEMPGIQKLYEQVGPDGIEFVMLSIDREGDQGKVSSYVKNNSYTFPVFMPSGNLPEQLIVPSIPTTFIVDKRGTIVYRHVGSTNYNSEKYIKLLKELKDSK